jgi:gamma-glutamylcyclotransferase (GGCT)/AIG2-like uncharacterized protein YtfP
MIYFAYGANIDPQQMRLRCRRGRSLGPARLDGYRLCFPRYSFIRQSALASIEKAPDESVWGALYEIEEADLARLDSCEGYYVASDPAGNPVNRVDVEPCASDGGRMAAFTYVANPMAYAAEPSRGYLSQLARCGRALDFPEDYIAKILAFIPVPAEAA